jgi:predicted Zn-dependent peptidase
MVSIALAVAALATAPNESRAQKLDRSQRPAPAPVRPFTFPAMERRALDNGLQIAVIENHELPVVAVRVVIEGGAMIDPTGKEGL